MIKVIKDDTYVNYNVTSDSVIIDSSHLKVFISSFFLPLLIAVSPDFLCRTWSDNIDELPFQLELIATSHEYRVQDSFVVCLSVCHLAHKNLSSSIVLCSKLKLPPSFTAHLFRNLPVFHCNKLIYFSKYLILLPCGTPSSATPSVILYLWFDHRLFENRIKGLRPGALKRYLKNYWKVRIKRKDKVEDKDCKKNPNTHPNYNLLGVIFISKSNLSQILQINKMLCGHLFNSKLPLLRKPNTRIRSVHNFQGRFNSYWLLSLQSLHESMIAVHWVLLSDTTTWGQS